MDEGTIRCEIESGVGILTICKPKVLNALSPDLLGEFSRAFAGLVEQMSGVRCIIITGTGRAFCAGADLSASGGNGIQGEAQESVLQRAYHPFLRQLRDSPVPIVAAVNGAAVGAGMSLAMMADILVCSRSAYFQQVFRRVGLVPDCGSSWLLPRRIGVARASEMMLLGDKLSADKALDWGLANRICDDDRLMEEAFSIATRVADGPLAALGSTRQLLARTFENSFDEQLDREDQFQAMASVSAEFMEGVAAFREKRPPDFRGC